MPPAEQNGTAAASSNAAPRAAMTISAAAEWGMQQLARAQNSTAAATATTTAPAPPPAAAPGNSERLDARALLKESLGLDDYADLLARGGEDMPRAAQEKYKKMITARADGHPVAYILGWREFYSRRFKTAPSALIPRPDTETLVEIALQHVPPAAALRVLDLGTGCGAIGISIALQRGDCIVTMTDVREDTLLLARENAKMHSAANTRFARGDWYAPVAQTQPFDVIVSNPPYVACDDAHLQRGDVRFEPPLALVGGESGLAALAQVICGAPRALKRGGALLVEHGSAQGAAVRDLFVAAGFCGQRTLPDLARLPRVTMGVLP